MKHWSPSTSQLATTGLLLALIGAAACESRQPISPDDVQIRAAKPPNDDGEEIVVLSALPSEGEQGAVGLKIHVFGEGFGKGAKVAFHLSPEADPDAGMTVQSTEFVSSTEVIATTDIALDAEVSSRYVSLSFRGRRGIGTEALFEVKQTGNSPPPPQRSVTVTVMDPSPQCDEAVPPQCADPSGIYSDDNAAGFAAYLTVDPGDDNLNLAPSCAEGRSIFVKNLPPDFPVTAAIPTCQGPGWMHLHLPQIMVEACPSGVYPCDYGDDTPAYVIKGKNKVQPRGGFGPTVTHFFQAGDVLYNIVWVDAQLHDPPGGPRRVTGNQVRLYGTQGLTQWDWEGEIALDVTVTPDPNTPQ